MAARSERAGMGLLAVLCVILGFVAAPIAARLADIECEVAADATIQEVWQQVAARYPALAPHTSSVSCARNEDFARMSAPVREGDAIAFLPPVSGGAPELE